MASLQNFLIMSPFVAANFQAATAGRTGGRIEPVLIRGGPHKNDYIMPLANKTNPVFADLLPQMEMLDIVTLDTEIAFPQDPDARGSAG